MKYDNWERQETPDLGTHCVISSQLPPASSLDFSSTCRGVLMSCQRTYVQPRICSDQAHFTKRSRTGKYGTSFQTMNFQLLQGELKATKQEFNLLEWAHSITLKVFGIRSCLIKVKLSGIHEFIMKKNWNYKKERPRLQVAMLPKMFEVASQNIGQQTQIP